MIRSRISLEIERAYNTGNLNQRVEDKIEAMKEENMKLGVEIEECLTGKNIVQTFGMLYRFNHFIYPLS